MINSEYKQFFSKLTLFLSPFALLIGLELFVFPIDKFTFRFYETFKVGYYDKELRGPFYPNKKLTKIEQGDLAANTQFAIKHEVYSCFDNYGFRKCAKDTAFDIVIVGDSFIWGSNLSQDQLLSEVLEKRTGLRVYPYAPSDINGFLNDPRFYEHPPKLVIFNAVERYIPDIPNIKKEYNSKNYRPDVNIWRKYDLLQEFAVYLDRIRDSRMYNYSRKKLFNVMSSRLNVKRSGMLFLQGASANKSTAMRDIVQYVNIVAEYNAHFKAKGISFMFLPTPNKENIYFKEFGDTINPPLIKNMTTLLKNRGVKVADIQYKFKKAYEDNNILLYHKDDTHWNINGVNIAAEVIDSMIKTNNLCVKK